MPYLDILPPWLVQMPWVLNESEYDTLQRRMSGTTPERMIREFAEVVEMLTARRPFVLVLEDLHWSDEETIDLVAMLGQRRDVARFMLLGTYRLVEVIERQHLLQTVSQELFLHGYSLELPLHLSSDTEVECYLTTRFPTQKLPVEFVHWLHRRTEGNPLFLGHILDYVLAKGWFRLTHKLFFLSEVHLTSEIA